MKQQIEGVAPCNPDAEREILGMFLQPNAETTIANAIKLLRDGEFFYHNKSRETYLAVKQLFEANMPIDPISIADKLKQNGSKYDISENDLLGLKDSVPIADPVNLEYYVKLIRILHQRRKLILLGAELETKAGNLTEDIGELLDTGLDTLQSIRFLDQNGDHSTKETLNDVFADLSNPETALNGVKTGFLDLDDQIDCFGNGDFIVVSGPTSIGKSTFCQNAGQHMAFKQNKHIIYISTELTVKNMILRLLSSESGMTYIELKRKQISKDKWQPLTLAASNIAKENFVILDNLYAIEEIEATCRWYKMLNKCDCVFLDHIGHIEVAKKVNTRTQELTELTKKIKQMAINLNVPIVCIHHMNRVVSQRQSKVPVLSDLKDSSSIEQDADIVMFLHNDEYYDEEPPEITDPVIDIYIRKVRNGRRGKVSLYFNSKEERYRNVEHKRF